MPVIRKMIQSTMKDDEYEHLLNEIPHATSNNNLSRRYLHPHHPITCSPWCYGFSGGVYEDMYFNSANNNPITCSSSSPVSGFSLQSDGGSSSSLFSNGHSLSDNGSPTPPPLEDLINLKSEVRGCSHNNYYPNAFNNDHESFTTSDELDLCRNLRSKMCISNDRMKNPSSSFNPSPLTRDCSFLRYGDIDNRFSRGFSEICSLGVRSSPSVSATPRSFVNPEMNPALFDLQQEYRSNALLSQINGFNNNFPLSSSLRETAKEQMNSYYERGSSLSNFAYSFQGGHSFPGGLSFPSSPHFTPTRPIQYNLPRPSSNLKFSQRGGGCLDAFAGEGSFIIQGDNLNHVVNNNKGFNRPKNGHHKTALYEIRPNKHLQKLPQMEEAFLIRSKVLVNSESGRNLRTSFPFLMPPRSLEEAQGYIYPIAKDQHGCRFLQRMFDEGSSKDVQMIFSEIIDHVVELMINPFGNYLMQKLLEVCSEEQRMQILFVATEEPGELVRISLNGHGTRVVQKLIETLKTRQQIQVVVSALEPGFLALIKDLNGNHVIQRCLQCLSTEDNKFIFVAAAKFFLEIATHQHGCCVLQRCISHSSGEDHEKLVAEISTNGLFLAQDPFGNYVVQFILDLKIPYATSNLISQFEGNYVHLSMQKCSSHVIEKCLSVLDEESRAGIIHELLSVSHFERVLQDPHANYVIQTALRVSEGPIHNMLVEAIESHKAISSHSPYSKKILSQKLVKK